MCRVDHRVTTYDYDDGDGDVQNRNWLPLYNIFRDNILYSILFQALRDIYDAYLIVHGLHL